MRGKGGRKEEKSYEWKVGVTLTRVIIIISGMMMMLHMRISNLSLFAREGAVHSRMSSQVNVSLFIFLFRRFYFPFSFRFSVISQLTIMSTLICQNSRQYCKNY